MTPSFIASVFFFCLLLLLLPEQHGASSSYASYKLGSRQIFFKTPGRSSGKASTVPSATTCSSIATGLGNNKLPVVHRQSPCSPLHGQPSLAAADVLRRDTSRIRQRRFSTQSSSVAAAPAPAPSPAATIIPANGSSDLITPPGALDYSVLVGYGTPAQQFPVFLDTTLGASVLRCKPCASGSSDCDPAFDASRSSTFAQVPCGSPDCPTTNCSVGSVCPFNDPDIPIEGSFARDLLTVSPSSSMAVNDFRFVCIDHVHHFDLPEAGTLDLSRDRNSLPSRLSSPAFFSYCLPQSPRAQGFLSLGGAANVGDGSHAAHAPLVSNSNPELASMYFIDLAGIRLGGEDLPIPAGTFGSTNLDVGTTFTMLPPDAYAPLRDSFLEQMSQYSNLSSPGIDGFDTCYNFTGLQELTIPLVRLKFGNGESLVIDGDQMLYYDNPTAGPFSMACLAFTALDAGDGDAFSAVIGSYTLATTEVVYDVAGGKVGFIPWSC